LANADGVPIERRGAHADDATFRNWGLWTGTVWSEQAEGTNGIGTCLVEKRLVTIHRDQHFLSRNALMSCTTAPIFDHRGKLVAVLDVSSCRADLTEGFLNLIQVAVSDAAKRIEAENFRRSFPNARFVLAPISESSPSALLAVNKDDLVVGVSNAARVALGLPRGEAIAPRPASDFFEFVQGSQSSLSDGERSILQQALAASGGNISSAARALGISRATLHRKVAKHALSR
jgi:transcriptional regulator of acetoin/glycerol metabolism